MEYLRRQKQRVRSRLDRLYSYTLAKMSTSPDCSQCVILFAQGRTGSTLLGTLIDSHPEIDFEHEILSIRDGVEAPHSEPYLYSLGRRIRSSAQQYGYHLKIYHLTAADAISPANYLRRAHTDGWSIVYLRRKNLLRHALSGIRRRATGETHRRSDEEREARSVESSGVYVDPNELVETMKNREEFQSQEEEVLSHIPHLELSYENNLLDPKCHQKTAKKVFEWVGLKSKKVEVSSPLEKINRGELEGLIQNYGEVYSQVEGTRFERFLDE